MFCNYNHHKSECFDREGPDLLIVKERRNQTKLLTIVPGGSGTIGETVTVWVAVVGVVVGAAAVTGVHQGPVMVAR
jgi:hypothetical protein